MALIPFYRAFTDYTPTIPKFYWDVYSQEERLKKLCWEYTKIIAYLDALCKAFNELNDTIDSKLSDFEKRVLEEVEQAIQEAVDNINKMFDDYKAEVDTKISDMDTKLDEAIKSQDSKINEAIKAQDAKIAEQDEKIAEMLEKYKMVDKLEGRIDEIEEALKTLVKSMLVYDPTKGKYTASVDQARRMVQILATPENAVLTVKTAGEGLTCEELSAYMCGEMVNSSFKRMAGIYMPYQEVGA